MIKVLFIGDIIGKVGRTLVKDYLACNKKEFALCIANGENASGGVGLTPKTAAELFGLGIDVITSGNHIWDKKEIIPHLDDNKNILRPANYPPTAPGYGTCIIKITDKVSVGVMNLSGRVFMPIILDCPFRKALEEIERIKKHTPIIIVDFHAEATSEKIAMGRFLDGKVSAVIGTHTHVQTADACILPNKTAYITDVGMTGPVDSIIGVETDIVLKRFLTGIPYGMKPSSGKGLLNAAIITINEDGKAEAIQGIRENC
ncbi:MAG: TIGR00282 family metallophosphoesterase [Candidatus Ratteibacteria bacterium]|nr:TIGR00282 family metallophosphoesterase [Candidatus Ratteibacteria bacterium]